MDMNKQILLLGDSIKFFEYAKQREVPVLPPDVQGETLRQFDAKIEKAIKTGISDLDFDPYFYLGTGQVSPEGWAIKK